MLAIRSTLRALLPAALLLALAACVPNAPHRTSTDLCTADRCTTQSIEQHPVPDAPGQTYLLGFVEFDDQGAQLLPAQMTTLFARMEAEAATSDLCIVTFVHGWKHNADATDPNVQAFQTLLASLAKTEAAHTPTGGRPRKLVGIYAGWRGQSSALGDLVSDLTFWDRKDAAQRVALGSIRDLLGRTRSLRDRIDRTTTAGRLLPPGTAPQPGEQLRSTRMLTIGHSFGGLIVYTALAQALIDRAATAQMAPPDPTAAGDPEKTIAAYGDLVVIVNPAVEATSWEPLRAILQNRPAASFAREQKPVFVEVTSVTDDATGIAFPLGRAVNTALENFVTAAQRQEANDALGHHDAFLTHTLSRAKDAPSNAEIIARQNDTSAGDLVKGECLEQAKFASLRQDGYLPPGWQRRYNAGAVLTHLPRNGFDANDPYWIIAADSDIIADHSDIENPIFVDFIHELYDELLLDGTECKALLHPG